MNLLSGAKIQCLLSALERVRTEDFFKKIYENFVGTLETVCNREVSIPRGSTVSLSPLSIVLYEPTTANEQVPRIRVLSSVEGGMASPLERNPIHVTMSSGPTLGEPNLYLFTALVNSKLVWDSQQDYDYLINLSLLCTRCPAG